MKEMNNLETYGTFEEVEEENVEEGANVIGSRWVVTKKERQDGQKEAIKARLVAQGFQESNKPQSDAPAAHRESFKLFLAVAAMKEFEICSPDICAAFLQAKGLDRDVYVRPPKDIKKDGIVWKLVKPLYGLDDASRRFWLRIRGIFKNRNIKTLEGGILI